MAAPRITVPRLFLSQDQLDRLIADDQAMVDGEVCELPAIGASFTLLPAVHFTALIEGDDRHGLVGCVKSEEHLRSLGADLLLTSAIVGDTAYECQPGFLAGGDSEAWIGRLSEIPH